MGLLHSLLPFGAGVGLVAALEYWRGKGLSPGPLGVPLRAQGLVQGGKAPAGGQRFLAQRTESTHKGVDIMAPYGSPVYAADAGSVAAAWPDGQVSGYGNTVVMWHPDGTQTLYAHLDRFADGIRRGAQRAKGDLLGYVGQTQKPRGPMQTPPHLHFEAHALQTLGINPNRPERLDPLAYLLMRGVKVAA